MRRLAKPVALVCCAGLLLQGCGWIEQHQKTLIGAGIGAAAGAGLGYAVRGKKGAVVGGLLGALAGGLIGHYMETRDKGAQETKRAANYTPEQGTRVDLAGVAADPNQVAAGGKVYLQATYAVLAPNDQAEVPLVETRVVTYQGTKVAELVSNVSRQPGTYTTQVPIDLRPDSPKGSYELTVSIAGAGTSTQRSATFVVN